MDIIFLEQVQVKTKLGVPQWERIIAQTILLDIEISFNLSAACKNDAINDTIDYSLVVGRIRETLKNNSFKLIEALAEHICQLILKEFKAKRVKVQAVKPGVLPNLKALGVIIERSA